MHSSMTNVVGGGGGGGSSSNAVFSRDDSEQGDVVERNAVTDAGWNDV